MEPNKYDSNIIDNELKSLSSDDLRKMIKCCIIDLVDNDICRFCKQYHQPICDDDCYQSILEYFKKSLGKS